MEKYSYYKTSCVFDNYLRHFSFQLPKTCVHCHEIMTPEIISQSEVYENQVAFLARCSHCQEFFAISYILFRSGGEYCSEIIPYKYSIKINYDAPPELEAFSPNFKEIYTQALTAEAYNLNHVAGIAYRKALEFLVKDFLIKVRNYSADDISNLPLSQAIDKIDNELICPAAKAATWIANDETHYFKKHEDKSLSDIRNYLRSVCLLLSAEYIALDGKSFINGNSSNKSN